MESRHGLPEWFWLKVSHENAVKVSAKAVVSSEGLVWVKEETGCTSRLIHVAVGRLQKIDLQ